MGDEFIIFPNITGQYANNKEKETLGNYANLRRYEMFETICMRINIRYIIHTNMEQGLKIEHGQGCVITVLTLS